MLERFAFASADLLSESSVNEDFFSLVLFLLCHDSKYYFTITRKYIDGDCMCSIYGIWLHCSLSSMYVSEATKERVVGVPIDRNQVNCSCQSTFQSSPRWHRFVFCLKAERAERKIIIIGGPLLFYVPNEQSFLCSWVVVIFAVVVAV